MSSMSKRAELLAPRLPQQPRAGLDGLDVLERIGRLRADVEGKPAHVDAQLRGQARQLQRVFRIAAELARQVADRARAAERHAQQQLGLVAIAAGTCAPRPGCRRRRSCTPACSALRMSLSRLIGCVWMQRAGSMPRRDDQLHLAGGGQVEVAAQRGDGAHHGRVRQRLQRVVQVHARQRLLQACGTARARARSRRSAAASRTRPPAAAPAPVRTDRCSGASWQYARRQRSIAATVGARRPRRRAPAGRGSHPSARRRALPAPGCARSRPCPACAGWRTDRGAKASARLPALIQVTYW